MRITQFTDYSLRLLMFLSGRRDQVTSVREISEYFGISAEHLKKVVRHQVELGYVETTRGKRGGLKLARAPELINVGQLIRSSENLALLPCHDAREHCPINGCKLASTVDQALNAFFAILDQKTLADLI